MTACKVNSYCSDFMWKPYDSNDANSRCMISEGNQCGENKRTHSQVLLWARRNSSVASLVINMNMVHVAVLHASSGISLYIDGLPVVRHVDLPTLHIYLVVTTTSENPL